MSARIILAMPGNETMAKEVVRHSSTELGALTFRRFPDGESYVRIECDVRGREVFLVCTLARPDPQIVPLILAAGALREWGAAKVHLVAAYLPYLRQDKHFNPGEALSARHIARLISAHFDTLRTVDPHLHRIKDLSEVYSIPARAVSAAPLLGIWIAANVANPFLLGPDRESAQWVASAAAAAGADYRVLAKTRRADASIDLDWPDLGGLSGKTPVLLDDIASSGRTLIAAAEGLAARGFARPVCAIVHALLEEANYAELQRVCARVISTDSVRHASNAVSVASLIAPN